MQHPFVIFGLPRSRTAWLAHWLGLGRGLVGHDMAIEANTAQGFLDALWQRAGTVETGAMRAWRLLRLAICLTSTSGLPFPSQSTPTTRRRWRIGSNRLRHAFGFAASRCWASCDCSRNRA
jgi:hypothetical protein